MILLRILSVEIADGVQALDAKCLYSRTSIIRTIRLSGLSSLVPIFHEY